MASVFFHVYKIYVPIAENNVLHLTLPNPKIYTKSTPHLMQMDLYL